MGEILLIRHGKTAGNLEGRYIGSRTDESLCEEGILGLKEKEYPPASRIYASPMRRCVETAGIYGPDVSPYWWRICGSVILARSRTGITGN